MTALRTWNVAEWRDQPYTAERTRQGRSAQSVGLSPPDPAWAPGLTVFGFRLQGARRSGP